MGAIARCVHSDGSHLASPKSEICGWRSSVSSTLEALMSRWMIRLRQPLCRYSSPRAVPTAMPCRTAHPIAAGDASPARRRSFHSWKKRKKRHAFIHSFVHGQLITAARRRRRRVSTAVPPVGSCSTHHDLTYRGGWRRRSRVVRSRRRGRGHGRRSTRGGRTRWGVARAPPCRAPPRSPAPGARTPTRPAGASRPRRGRRGARRGTPPRTRHGPPGCARGTRPWRGAPRRTRSSATPACCCCCCAAGTNPAPPGIL